MIRVGVVNIDTSHPNAFAQKMIDDGRARYVAIYNDGFRGDDEVNGFMEKFGLEKHCKTVEELAEMVDIGFIQGCNWDTHLNYVDPFIKLGKPVFIDKPIVGSMPDLKKLKELTDAGAVILGSSSARYAQEIEEFLAIPEEERGQIVSVFGSCGVDEFNYGVHIVEIISGLLGMGAQDCRFAGRATVGDKVCETFVATFDSGVTATYSLFQGTWQPFTVTIQTTKKTYTFTVDTSRIYMAMLKRIMDYMQTGESTLAPIDELSETIKIMLAGKISRENDGKVVALSEIPADYEGYDGALFEKGYAAAANKMYLYNK